MKNAGRELGRWLSFSRSISSVSRCATNTMFSLAARQRAPASQPLDAWIARVHRKGLGAQLTSFGQHRGKRSARCNGTTHAIDLVAFGDRVGGRRAPDGGLDNALGRQFGGRGVFNRNADARW